MANDFSTRVFDLFSGKKRVRRLPTLVIALAVTALVVVPFLRASDDETGDGPTIAAADPASVLVDTSAGDPSQLDRSVVEGAILISVQDGAASAVSFTLFAAGTEEPLLASQDLEGPAFDLILSDSGAGKPLDSTMLDNGDYELFLTIAGADGEQRTAVGFSVVNP